MVLGRTSGGNRRWVVVALALFGLPLAVVSILSGMHWAVGAVLFAVVAVGFWGLLRLLTRRMEGGPLAAGPGKVAASGALSLLLVAGLIQLVPYGRSHDNPPVTAEPAWDSPRTRELAVKACFDCHSNEVEYPWYADVAPVSWAVQRHVEAGRAAVNYSEWDRPQEEAHESAETVEEGSMPPWYYTWRRPGLLSDTETQELIRGLVATFGDEDGDHGRGGEDGDDDDDDDDDD